MEVSDQRHALTTSPMGTKALVGPIVSLNILEKKKFLPLLETKPQTVQTTAFSLYLLCYPSS